MLLASYRLLSRCCHFDSFDLLLRLASHFLITHTFDSKAKPHDMRLAIPSFSLGATIATPALLEALLTQDASASCGSKANQQFGHESTAIDTSYMSIKKYEEHISQQIKQKVNAKIELREKIAGAVSSLFTDEEPASFKSDVGILTCANPQDVCVKSSSSSLGGFCVSADVDIANRKLERERQLVTRHWCYYTNGTKGEKCHGWFACRNLSDSFIENNVGCGSCNGCECFYTLFV
jgi:hypothetical protein